jgi:hypothetical protein
MTYLSRRMREHRYEDEVPADVRQDVRSGVTVRFMGRDVDAVTAWRMSGVWPWIEAVDYMGRGA